MWFSYRILTVINFCFLTLTPYCCRLSVILEILLTYLQLKWCFIFTQLEHARWQFYIHMTNMDTGSMLNLREMYQNLCKK